MKKTSQRSEYENSLNITFSPIKTHVYMQAVSKTDDKPHRIQGRNIQPLKGGGHIYDLIHDCYHTYCNNVVYLGLIPFSIVITVDKNNYWNVQSPIPETLLIESLTEDQKKIFDKFHKDNKTYEISYLQFLDT